MEDADDLRKRWHARMKKIGREAFIDELYEFMQATANNVPVDRPHPLLDDEEEL